MEDTRASIYGVCPFATTQKVLAGKWTIVILYQLSTGTKRFNQLQRLLPGITQTILMKQLRQLEKDKLVIRTVYAEVPPRVEYKLSELGKNFKSVLDSIETWGLNYIKELELTGE
ncbi:helix-turn-helix domain-containing protein [Oscillospiraceae bacterium PP1C4]